MNAFKYSFSILILIKTLGQTTQAEPISFDMHQAESGNFYVSATLAGNVDTDLLLDTGSGYVSIGKDTFTRISKNLGLRFSRYTYGRMASGKVEKVTLYFVDELKLSNDCILKNIEVAHFPKADKDILGLNALSRLQPFTVQLAPVSFTSSNCDS